MSNLRLVARLALRAVGYSDEINPSPYYDTHVAQSATTTR